MSDKILSDYTIRVVANGYVVYETSRHPSFGNEGSLQIDEDIWVFETLETLYHFMKERSKKPPVDLFHEMVKANIVLEKISYLRKLWNNLKKEKQ